MRLLRALIVHCEEDISLRLTGMLAICGFDTVVAGDTIGALQMASDEGIDLIVTDLDDPAMGGPELMDLVRRGVFGGDPPPVIACRSRLNDAARLAPPGFGPCAAFLDRPITMDALVAAIDRAMPIEYEDVRLSA